MIDSIFKGLALNNYRKFFIILAIVPIVSLVFAYYVEHILEITPCTLCIYQRIPYYILFCLSILGISCSKLGNVLHKIIMLNILVSVLISGYHYGIEKGIFNEPRTCKVNTPMIKNLSVEARMKLLDTISIVKSCKAAPFKIIGMSMSMMNFLYSIVLLLLCYIVNLYYSKYAKADFC
ncbi:disulfide bond formation DsbB family protein [Orientia chuto str. Dubai]|uniref:Disulfide bond formation DsbB family protein n=1 Tax=Orientia chuto str. Dubai TaxID=1359168 RepID=A0A0F3MN74_9RICK|nr:disulfide bond formation protein B [Candidatus Orientia mediorientalis]KJV57185.1 disulfide bond formation DsbB family protein [Orientia chuto str. Dubai]